MFRNLDPLDRLFVVWAFLFQVVLIVHFAVRQPLFETYTTRFGWIVYALAIPAAAISLVLMRGGKRWWFWLGGFLFVAYAIFGYWVDYVAQIEFRDPLRWSVAGPYVLLYLATVMFYWWPLARIRRSLWAVYTVLFVIAMVLNITSH